MHPNNPKRTPRITLEVVQRIADRVSVGVPLDLACAAEGDRRINPESWEKALKRKPQFAGYFHQARARFIEKAIRQFSDSDDLRWLSWLLERRHGDLFSRSAEASTGATHGLPAELLARFHEKAKKL